MLTCNRPTLPGTVFAVGPFSHICSHVFARHCLRHVCRWLERVFSLHPLAISYFCLSIHTYTHLPSSDTASDTVCRWFDRVVYLQLQTVSLLAFNNPQIHSLAINISDSVCRWLDQVFFLQINVRIPFHRYAHLSSPYTVCDSSCRWLDRVCSLKL